MPYSTAVVEGLINFMSKNLDKNRQDTITDWINNNILITSSKLEIKQAFVKAQRVMFQEYIIKNDVIKIKSLLDAINTCGNKKLIKLECEILSDVCLKEQGFLSANTESHKSLVKILNDQLNLVQDVNLKSSIEGKITEVSQTQEANICKTGDPQVIKKQKWYINNFIEKLFKIDMSQDVLVDIVINDDLTNPCNNQTTIVGRPKVLGSSTKQMRHVTPYSFIAATIKEKIVTTTEESDYVKYINNIAEATKPLLKNKKGICLTDDQYSKLSSSISLPDEEYERFKLSTTSNEYHLIYNDALIEQFKNCDDFSQAEKDKAEKDFSTKFEKYITYGIKYLTEEILDLKDVNAVTIVCEGIARIILTLFNQEKYAVFPEEGNALKEEIRVYDTPEAAEHATKLKLEQQKYEVRSHNEITKENILQYDLRIRIVDNEGTTVNKVAKVLKIISSLVSSKVFGKEKAEDKEYQKEYNTKYNFLIKDEGLKCKNEYNKDIDINNNLMDIFQYHIAKHLYSVFDFKPLEKNVLVPKQKEDERTIKVYPSAVGIKTAAYAVQSGEGYRASQYNSRKGYNDDAIFRLEMSNKDTINVLKEKVVNHVIISLLPFKGLEIGCIFDDEQCERATILQAFCELVKVKYKAEGMIQLDNTWINDVQTECSRYFEDVLGESRVIEDNYDV